MTDGPFDPPALRAGNIADLVDAGAVILPDQHTIARRDLGDHPARLRYLDLHPLTFGRVRVSRSDGWATYGEAY